MAFQARINDMTVELPDGTVEHPFTFYIDSADVMNSNKIGYAKTPRGQMALNGKRNTQKRRLVEMGHEAAEGVVDSPITKAFVVCEVANTSSKRFFDPPNLELTEKHLMDGMVQTGLLTDDNSGVITGGTWFVEHRLSDDEKRKAGELKNRLSEHEDELRERAKKNGRKRKNKRIFSPYVFCIRVFDLGTEA